MERTILISIGEAAKMMHVSIDTLRRWDKEGRFPAIRRSGRRFYRRSDIEKYLDELTIAGVDLFELARNWTSGDSAIEPDPLFYCANSSVFQYRLNKLEKALGQVPELVDIFPLITSITGEIGNNSFDHNIGRWPDIPGVFFGYDIERKEIVLADRGQGVLATLKGVRPELATDEEGLNVAFTEVVSGRPKEARGNGLKYVKDVVMENDLSLLFKTGNAKLRLKKGDTVLDISRETGRGLIKGCLAKISF